MRRSSRFREGLFRLADPKITLASAGALLIGACAARRHGDLAWGWLALTALGIFAIEVAKNASGEIVDFDSGTDSRVAPEDRSPFSGGKRVLVESLLTRAETALIAIAGYAAFVAVGLLISLAREPRVLWLGIAGGALAFFYHAPPLKLSYRGLGELAVGLCYGPLIVIGVYLVQRGSAGSELVWLTLPYALLVLGFLWINEFPDLRADRSAGKRTLVVRLGARRASRVFGWIGGFALLALGALPLLGFSPWVWLAGFAGIPFARAARILRDHPEETARLIPAQRLALLAFVLLAALLGAGLWLGGTGLAAA